MVSLLESCSESCGWIAAIIAVLSWGTFGVPLKINTNVEVNFFVMQSYKTIVCFATCWLVILLGEPVRFTPWGIVSGLFWVPGASCGVYAIRNAGVAISAGTWSAIQVCTSFIFGIIIFEERVKDKQQTMLAFLILITGLVGMSMYSESPKSSHPKTAPAADYELLATSESRGMTGLPTTGPSHLPKRHITGKTTSAASAISSSNKPLQIPTGIVSGSGSVSGASQGNLIPLEFEDSDDDDPKISTPDTKIVYRDRITLLGGRLSLTRRQLGIAGAVVNGAWGGLNLIPLHYARRDQGLSGAGYLISYASGSMLVCLAIWLGLFLYHAVKQNYKWREAMNQLPAWHVQELGFAGLLAGIFYSIGNFCSILAVTYLGQGVGFSFCQGQLLVSGLWGVCYFHEIQGRETVAKWFASACITVVGIICLSYQHEGAPVH